MPAYDLIIRNGQVVTTRDVIRASIAVSDEKIVAVAPDISGSAPEEIDATGLHVFPGLIDPHVHFNEPGRTEWEGIATGSAALAAGGGACFFDMPLNSSPPVLNGPSFDAKLAAARQKSVTDFALWGGLTPNNLDKLDELAARGVIGFKAFMCDSGIADFPRADDYTLFEGMKHAARLGLPVAVHAESEELTAGAARARRARGDTDPGSHYASRPRLAEIEAIGRAILLAESAECDLHVVHVSSKQGVALVESARRRGVRVTCETCPHYLTLTSDAVFVRVGAALTKCAPPIRDATQQAGLWEHLLAGRIDFVASDHSPSPPSMKQADDYFEVWGGIAGVQSTLPLLLTNWPDADTSLPHIARATSTNAAARFSASGKGSLAAGLDADMCLVDLSAEFCLKAEDLLYRHKISPYIGRFLRGVVRRTVVRGTTVYRDGKIVSKPIGRLVKPA